MSDNAEIAYLLAAALFMLIVSVRSTRGRSLAWRGGAVLIWAGLFAGLVFVVQALGLKAP